MEQQASRVRVAQMTQTGPHAFRPLRRFFNRGRCLHCFVHEHAHPVGGWTEARAIGDRKIGVFYD
jgi:hypothetical protein